jgi:hypothetical protein
MDNDRSGNTTGDQRLVSNCKAIKAAGLSPDQKAAAQMLCIFKEMELARLQGGQRPIHEATISELISWVTAPPPAANSEKD